jgi:glycosidase
MPTFNYFKPEVVDAMTDSALWWFKNFDIDGFRHDATKHIPDPFWRSLTYKLKTEVALPNHRPYYQIGETYGSPELISSYLGSGTLDAQFDFNMYDAAVMAFKGHGSCKNLAQTLNDSKKWYGAHHTMGNVSGNQDKPRIISLLDGSIKDGEDTKQAGWDRDIQVNTAKSESTNSAAQSAVEDDNIHAHMNPTSPKLSVQPAYLSVLNIMAFNMSIPGIPVIYYGDEIGMPGANDPDCRRMMRFDQGIQSNSDVSVAVTDMSVDELLAGRNSGSVVAKTPGAKAMTGKMQLGLSEQERELRTWISQLINFRNTHLALTYGDMEVSALGDDLLIIKRKYFGEIVYAVFNRSTESKTVELSFSDVANFTKTKNGKSYLGIVGAVHTFNDSPLITDDVNTYTVVIPAGGFEYIYN